MILDDLGWTAHREREFSTLAGRGWVPARVTRADKDSFQVWHAEGQCAARIAGRMRHRADRSTVAVGDWIAISTTGDSATIHEVLARKSTCVRKAAGVQTVAQVVAANVDYLLMVTGLDGDFNVRRIERYLAFAYGSGAAPVIVLNKSDLCHDLSERLAAVQVISPGVPVHALCATDAAGMEVLRPYRTNGTTLALVGSSGVGKSTLVNALIGQALQATKHVRSWDDRGRHTTTRRELFLLPGGGVVIDTPGMRELQLWSSAQSLDGAFSEIDALAAECRFRDCAHLTEPCCAVLNAAQSGDLDPRRLASYRKLQRELHHLELRQDKRAQLDEKARIKSFHKRIRHISHKRTGR